MGTLFISYFFIRDFYRTFANVFLYHSNMTTRHSPDYILSDANTPADFVEAINNVTEKDWILLEKITLGTMPKWRRKLTAYLFTFKFMCCHPKAKQILAWQQMFGILPAFFNRYLFHRKKLHINIMTFIYKPKHGLAGKIYHWLFKSAIYSKYVKHIFVFSETEIAHYSSIFPEAKDKFHFVTLGIPMDNTDYTDNTLSQENYYFSTGLSNRDYDFLIKVFDGIPAKLKIACPNLKQSVPDNIRILHSCFGTDMKKYMFNSRAVLIPLKDLNISSGQLVFIAAMQMGKPIIITDSSPTRSYLNDDNAFILKNDIESWRKAIKSLDTDPLLCAAIGKSNRIRAEREFSAKGLGEKIGNILH